MPKVTKKLQITIPKAIATSLGIGPGAELVVEATGEVMLLRPIQADSQRDGHPDRLTAFQEATERQRQRDIQLRAEHPDLFQTEARGWSREDLYDRRISS